MTSRFGRVRNDGRRLGFVQSLAPREWVRFTSSTPGEILHYRVASVVSDEIVVRPSDLAATIRATRDLRGSSALGNDVRMTIGAYVASSNKKVRVSETMLEVEDCLGKQTETDK